MIGSFTLDADQEITTVEAVTLDIADQSVECFAVGSMFYEPQEKETSTGQIYVYRVLTDRGVKPSISAVATIKVPGCVYDIKSFQGKIAAAINTGVSIRC